MSENEAKIGMWALIGMLIIIIVMAFMSTKSKDSPKCETIQPVSKIEVAKNTYFKTVKISKHKSIIILVNDKDSLLSNNFILDYNNYLESGK